MLAYDLTGWIHLVVSILALIAGSFVMCTKKGTKRHKIIGYFYSFFMLSVLVTALLIYRLTGGFNVFHFIAIAGFFYLIMGLVPMVLKRKNRIKTHIYFMYWSVIGLYAALVAEVLVRVPNTPFWWMVGVGVAVVTGIASYYYVKKKKLWYTIVL